MNIWDGLTSFQVIYETSKSRPFVDPKDLPWGRWCDGFYTSSEMFKSAKDWVWDEQFGPVFKVEVEEYFGLTPEWTEACKAWYELSDEIRKQKDMMNA